MSVLKSDQATGIAARASSAVAAEWPSDMGQSEPAWGGLRLIVWVKIGLVSLLMLLLFRFNLSRLWLKTNWWSGQDNWQHALIIPLIGLYYLYVNRDELIHPAPLPSFTGTLSAAWSVVLQVEVVLVALVCAIIPISAYFEPVLTRLGLMANYHGWPLAPAYLFLMGAVPATVLFLLLNFVPSMQPGLDGSLGSKAVTWVERIWPRLLAWTMGMIVTWGSAFFISICVSSRLFVGIERTLSVVSLLLLLIAVVDLAAFGQMTRDLSARLLESAAGPWLGAFVLIWGILFSMWGIWPGQNDFFKDVGMVIALFGAVLHDRRVGGHADRLVPDPFSLLRDSLARPGLQLGSGASAASGRLSRGTRHDGLRRRFSCERHQDRDEHELARSEGVERRGGLCRAAVADDVRLTRHSILIRFHVESAAVASSAARGVGSADCNHV